MRLSAPAVTVLFGLVAAAIANPMGGDAASDLYARDFDSEVSKRDVSNPVYNRSIGKNGFEARAGSEDDIVNVEVIFVGDPTANAAHGPRAKKEDAMKIVEFAMRGVWPKLELRKNLQPGVLGEVTAANDPFYSLENIQWRFRIGKGRKCGGWCYGYAKAFPGAGGVHPVQTAHVKTSGGAILWEKKPNE